MQNCTYINYQQQRQTLGPSHSVAYPQIPIWPHTTPFEYIVSYFLTLVAMTKSIVAL